VLKQGAVRPREAAASGISRMQLARLAGAGKLERVATSRADSISDSASQGEFDEERAAPLSR
jgi:hypothetical protein